MKDNTFIMDRTLSHRLYDHFIPGKNKILLLTDDSFETYEHLRQEQPHSTIYNCNCVSHMVDVYTGGDNSSFYWSTSKLVPDSVVDEHWDIIIVENLVYTMCGLALDKLINKLKRMSNMVIMNYHTSSQFDVMTANEHGEIIKCTYKPETFDNLFGGKCIHYALDLTPRDKDLNSMNQSQFCAALLICAELLESQLRNPLSIEFVKTYTRSFVVWEK